MKITAKVQRSGDWWAIRVPEVDGAFSHAKRLDQVAELAADAVAVLEDVAPTDIEVTIEADLPQNAGVVVEDARTSNRRAAAAQSEASIAMHRAAQHLRTVTNLSVRDVAQLLGISHQRVSQILSTPPRDVSFPPPGSDIRVTIATAKA